MGCAFLIRAGRVDFLYLGSRAGAAKEPPRNYRSCVDDRGIDQSLGGGGNREVCDFSISADIRFTQAQASLGSHPLYASGESGSVTTSSESVSSIDRKSVV